MICQPVFVKNFARGAGICITRYRANTRLQPQMLRSIEQKAEERGAHVYTSRVRLGVAVQEAQARQMDLAEWKEAAAVARDYEALIDEYLQTRVERSAR